MRLFSLAALAGACLATSPLLAADLFSDAAPPMSTPASEELGSNWYIRGDIGYGETKQATVVPEAGLFPSIGNQPNGNASSPVSITRGNTQSSTDPAIGVGFGYRVNDWFRAEADWQISNGPGFSTQKNVYCPEVANAVSNNVYSNPQPSINALGQVSTTYTQTAVPFGYAYDYTTCGGNLNVRQYNNTALAMGYFDLGHWGIFTPYIGAGVGMNANTMTGSLTFNQNDTGANYTGPVVTGSAPGIWAVQSGTDMMGLANYAPLPKPAPTSGTPQPIGPANWTRTINSTKYTIAGSLAAGVGMQISQSATLDIGYKFLSYDLTHINSNMMQSFNIGVRYNIN